MEKVLVTGAAGFIGRSVVQILVSRGYRVIGLDNYHFSNEDQVPRHSRIAWVKGDTRDPRIVREILDKVDHVIHLAAPSSFIMHEEDDLQACNFTIMGFKTLMEGLRKRGLQKVVWASTSAVYEEWGKEPRVPFHEDLPIDPPDSKAGCKWWCEQEATRYYNRYGISSVAFRPFSVYGVGEHTKLGYANVTSLFTWALMGNRELVLWGDGTQTRDFIFVEDVASAFVDAIEKDVHKHSGEGMCALNLGFGVEHTFNDVVSIASSQLEVAAKIRYIDVPIQIYAYRLWADMAKTRRVLGFEPKITLEEGIARIIEATRSLPPAIQQHLFKQQHYFEEALPQLRHQRAVAN